MESYSQKFGFPPTADWPSSGESIGEAEERRGVCGFIDDDLELERREGLQNSKSE